MPDAVVELQLLPPCCDTSSTPPHHKRSTSDSAAVISAASKWPGAGNRRALFEDAAAMLSPAQKAVLEAGAAGAGAPARAAASHHMRTISMPPLNLSALADAREGSPRSGAQASGQLTQELRTQTGVTAAARPFGVPSREGGPASSSAAEPFRPVVQNGPVSGVSTAAGVSSTVPRSSAVSPFSMCVTSLPDLEQA